MRRALSTFVLLLGCSANAPAQSEPLPPTASDPETAASASTAPRGSVDAAARVAPPVVLDPPTPADATLVAPASYRVRVKTTEGEFVLEIDSALAPNGATRFYNLVAMGYFTNIAVFRAIPNFVVQFGLHGTPSVNKDWKDATFLDDAVVGSNVRGTITFARTGAVNSSNRQLFINLGDNVNLDGLSFAPIGRVIEGMEVVDALYTGYGEGGPRGGGPSQQKIERRGNAYLEQFPNLSYIQSMEVEPAAAPG
ncbi:MAG: peptidylprolyl isomerase [Myxococcota bacterium]